MEEAALAAVKLAVVAHLRHAETPCDELLASGWERREARSRVEGRVAEVLDAGWRGR